MKNITKYFQVARITWKSMLAYRADTWLGAALVGFRVLLSFLLWMAVFAGRESVGGYTLPMMVTYALVTALLARLQHQDALAWQLANEVRGGTFSKYLVHPISVMGFFLSAGLGRWTYLLLINAAALSVWSLIFSGWLVLPGGVQALWLLLLLPLGALCMLLFNHNVALLSLRFQDVGGLMILKGSIIEFVSGAIIPLSLLPDPLISAFRFMPFYYVIYYPTSLLLGTQTEPPLFAVGMLLLWCCLLAVAGQVWFLWAGKYYEGVGI